MDRRQQKTREAILSAFGSLLSKKRFSNITVKEIIDTANVGRATFYAHFETKDYLLKEMCVEMFNHVFSESLYSESTHDFSSVTGETSEIITHILYHLLDNKKNIMGILTCESGELFIGFFKQYLNKLVAKKIIEGKDEGNIPQDFLINHISSSFIGMVQWWIKNDLQQTPEELSDYFMSVTTPIISI